MLKWILLMMLPLSATAATLSWEAPTTREDGSSMTPAEIAEYRVYYAIDTIPTLQSTEVIVTEGLIKEVELNLLSGTYVVNFGIVTVDTDGLSSQMSEIVSKSYVIKSPPGPPTNLTIKE